MGPIPSDLYLRWRAESPGLLRLRENPPGAPPPEHLLQQIWRHQRLHRDHLKTTAGERLTILHPGFWNREAGPDFRDAVLQFGEEPAVTGDVEVDLAAEGWHHHGHDLNPNYRRVRLHVVWKVDAAKTAPLPTVAIREAIDAPLSELEEWLGTETAAVSLAGLQAGQCAGPLNRLETDTAIELLTQAASVRLRQKASQLRARARDAGWEQALWEAVLAALGYKHNAWPMRRLGELRARLAATEAGRTPSPLELQARLLGVSGLLPSEPPRAGPAAREHWRRLWDLWWRERAALAPASLPRSVWRLAGVRPANHPQRRLALAAGWMADPDWARRLQGWATDAVGEEEPVASLLRVLQPPRDDFWERHWTFGSAVRTGPQPLLGPPRATDLAMNAILPWFWSRADAGENLELRERVERRYFAWPAAQDNALLRLARLRLFAGRRVTLPRRAALQQGLMQIVRDFCDHSNALCDGCCFPQLVGGLQTQPRSL
ncbi:MAG: DUF2851 family protein [Limisphaerales bacterium]